MTGFVAIVIVAVVAAIGTQVLAMFAPQASQPFRERYDDPEPKLVYTTPAPFAISRLAAHVTC